MGVCGGRHTGRETDSAKAQRQERASYIHRTKKPGMAAAESGAEEQREMRSGMEGGQVPEDFWGHCKVLALFYVLVKWRSLWSSRQT